jgi:hypothetical protein
MDAGVTPMTKTSQWIALAKLEERTFVPGVQTNAPGASYICDEYQGHVMFGRWLKDLPNYNSRNVLIELLEKQPVAVQEAVMLFLCGNRFPRDFPTLKQLFFASHEQIQEQLLRATGLWKDE